jgi:hypothetical protein
LSSNVTLLPVWKQDATAEERFLELAHMAREKPERFEKVIVGWVGTHEGQSDRTNYVTTGCDAIEAIGLATITRRNVEDWTMNRSEN